MNRRAIILAGGKGSRLRPYTVVLPKPLMPIGDYPILEVIIRQLVHFDFDHITLAVNHQADLLKAYFGDGTRWNVNIDYSLEKTPLGTMGPLQLISDLPENFLIMNGDVLSDLDYGQFYAEHQSSNSVFTISSKKRNQIIDYGVLEVNDSCQLNGFTEKPKQTYEVSMGIYMANRNVLRYIQKDKPYGFDNLMLDMLKAGEIVQVKTYAGYWLDIGRPDDYILAIDEFDTMKNKFLYV